MARPVSIRSNLVVNLVLIIVLLGGTIMGMTFIGARRALQSMAGSLAAQSLDQIDARMEQFFEPVNRGLLMARRWGESGRLDTDDPRAFEDLLVPYMQQYPQVSSIVVADGRGRDEMILRTDDRWRHRSMSIDDRGDEAHWREWSAESPEPILFTEHLQYDPRTRPWYLGAIQLRDSGLESHDGGVSIGAAARIHWTVPYQFFTTGEAGITASIVYDHGDAIDRAIGFDVLLYDLSTFTIDQKIGENGMVFVVTTTGEVIGLPADERFDDPTARREALLKNPAELNLVVARDGALAFSGDEPSDPTPHRPRFIDTPVRFESEGRTWWGVIRPFQLATTRSLWIAVVVPEADLLANATQQRVTIILLTIAALALAIQRAVGLARRYSRPIEALVRQSDRISRGDLEPGELIESRVVEVLQLAEAQDRMRDGLQSLMKLERDLQLARQIQQSTFPADLPHLDGFEIEAWSDPAEETGGDTYDVIGFRSIVAAGSADRESVVAAEDPDRAILLLADATGHGIGPALSVTQVRSMLRMAVRSGESLPRIARHMNEQLSADLPIGRFITAWLGELNVADHTLTSFSAGQAPLLMFDAANSTFGVINADTLPMGIVPDMEIPVADPIPMVRGDIFAVISDGVFEAMNRAEEQFGTNRVTEVIAAHRDGSPAEILRALRVALDAFTEGLPAADDRTAILIKRTG